jgi:MFS family permease
VPEQQRAPQPSARSLAGLDWFTFCLADVQTAFGPLVAVYLTTQKWTQVDIGLVLSIGGLVGLIGQAPGGALVDAVRSERLTAAVAVAGIGSSALLLAAWPIFQLVLLARIIHAIASCILVPAIAAISLGLVGHARAGERLGRNARFASLGTGIAAAVMGACGHFFSSRAVFFFAAALLLPTYIALAHINSDEIDADRAHGGTAAISPSFIEGLGRLLRQPALIIFAFCTALFQFANAAMLPLMGSITTMRRGDDSALVLIAACLVVPQFVVAAISPWIGRHAESWGRRPMLLLGFFALPLRGLLFASTPDPVELAFVQLLDGVSAAAIGVLLPLVIADLARDSGHFNLAQGLVGTGAGLGAALSPTFAGYLTDHYGSQTAFLGLSIAGILGLLLVICAMPETRPSLLKEKPNEDEGRHS